MRSYLISAACAALVSLVPVMARAGSNEAGGFTWTGMFVGINAGYGVGTSDWDFGAGGSNSRDMDGGVVGLQAGYNAQLTNGLVAGVEISTEATNLGGKSGCSGNDCKSSVGSLTDVSGRLGLNWGTSMLFGKAGIAYENRQHNIVTSASDFQDKGGSLGYVAGAGLEFYIDHNITSKLEYNYYHFGSDTATLGASRIEDATSLSVVKAGFNLKFN
jgi:outer membrane immunogenic protein